MPVGAPSKFNSEYCIKAEEILASGKSLAAVCAHMNIARSTLYEWRDNHPEFKYALDCGLQKSQAYWEEVGMEGVIGEIEKFSSAPWIFTMKCRFKDDYKEDKEPSKAESAVEKFLLGKLIE